MSSYLIVSIIKSKDKTCYFIQIVFLDFSNKNRKTGKQVLLYLYCSQEVVEKGRRVNISRRRLVRLKEIGPSENAEYWATAIQPLLQVSSNSALNTNIGLHPSKPILFLVNPKSGSGRAMWMFEKQVMPILRESGVDYEMIPTLRKNYGRWRH